MVMIPVRKPPPPAALLAPWPPALSWWCCPLDHGNCTTGPWYRTMSTAPATVRTVPAILAWLCTLRSRTFSMRRTRAMTNVTAGRMFMSADAKPAEVRFAPM
uniref:Uncharacterized protein n=1 Tax=Zea mays TaxID=4577 RepID=C4J4T7_MAIZE|nr:unknown [Zea mays]